MSVDTRSHGAADKGGSPGPRDELASTMIGIGRSCACLQARMTARTLTRLYSAAIRSAGLEPTQFSLLGAIAVGGAPSIAKLAERLAVERTTLVRNLDILRRDGLIAREGARAIDRLTPAGEAALRRAIPLWREAQARVEAELGTAGLAAFATSMRDLRALAPAPSPKVDGT